MREKASLSQQNIALRWENEQLQEMVGYLSELGGQPEGTQEQEQAYWPQPEQDSAPGRLEEFAQAGAGRSEEAGMASAGHPQEHVRMRSESRAEDAGTKQGAWCSEDGRNSSLGHEHEHKRTSQSGNGVFMCGAGKTASSGATTGGLMSKGISTYTACSPQL